MSTLKLSDLTDKLIAFREARDWKQFHTPKNLAISISIEAAELLELFQWTDGLILRTHKVKEEIADIFIYLLYLSHDLKIDLPSAVISKIQQNEQKYPVERSKGNARKHTEL